MAYQLPTNVKMCQKKIEIDILKEEEEEEKRFWGGLFDRARCLSWNFLVIRKLCPIDPMVS